ncbi:hypothetical protein [Parasegetibacter sp. NRK P23]|uniref:hypothetical protein n=1 Tax=Parasegetibacter sp. NRK P23 TaxID=2942999 RepID=UPI0020430BB0|nr:hypothetical protein [Parasegetibacter sp. NRK P23]MCM5527324.1 hypothetical protein [Parasegetibacter sp. NRK P23]
MREDFEKQVQQQGAGYRIAPREDVWNRISAELDQKKKRRLAWWWFPVGLAGAAIPILLFTGILSSGEKKSPSSATRQEHSSFSTPGAGNSRQQRESVHATDASASNKPPVSIVQGSTPFNRKTGSNRLSAAGSSNTVIKKEKTAHGEDNSSALILPDEAEKNIALLPEVITTAPPVFPAIDLLQEKKPGTFDIPTNSTGSIVVNGQRFTRHKGFWQIEVASGLSNMKDGIPSLLRPFAYQDSYSYNSPVPGNGSVGSQVPGVIYSPRAGASYSAFLNRVQPLSDQWTLTAGLGFQHLRFTQFTGSRKDTSFNTQFTGFENKSINHFYRAGNTQEHSGYFSRVAIASSIAYKLPVLQQRISLKAGVQAGYNAGAVFLVPDYSTGTYLPLSSAKKTISASVSGGISYHTKQAYQFSLQSIYDITRAYSPISSTSNYWRQWQFSAAIPVSFKK